MTEIIALRGLPGSGKSTTAKMLQSWVRVNRDDLRKSLFNAEGILSFEKEELITKVQRSIAAEALNTGRNVIVDDTNLRNKYLRAWDEFAMEHGADFLVHDMDTPVEECIKRDAYRQARGERWVGPQVIRDLARKFLRNGEFPAYQPIQRDHPVVDKVEWDPDLSDCILVDIDGTVALNDGHRGWYDWDKVGGDKPNQPVIDLVRALIPNECIIFFSGRDESCRKQTTQWLNKHVHMGYDGLFMRPEGDTRRDDIVKRELFDAHIRGQYNVKFILDDRNQVVRMWRSLGIPTFQVAEGNF